MNAEGTRTYFYTDETVQAGQTCYYALEEVENDGHTFVVKDSTNKPIVIFATMPEVK